MNNSKLETTKKSYNSEWSITELKGAIKKGAIKPRKAMKMNLECILLSERRQCKRP